jgi:hypothetical protein
MSTVSSGMNGRPGTVFELVKSGAGYTLATLVSFNGTNGAFPDGSLIADANGDLFGRTSGGGANNDGTGFEITGSGFLTTGCTNTSRMSCGASASSELWRSLPTTISAKGATSRRSPTCRS